MLKLYPEIIFKAIQHSLPTGAFRVWLLAKDFNPGGGGFIPAKAFRQHLRKLGIPKQTLSRWLMQAQALGLVQAQGNIYELAGWLMGAKLAGVARLNRPVLIPRERFIAKGWLAWCWAGYVAHFPGPMARATLDRLSGVPPRTQQEYEGKAGVVNIANFASFGRVVDKPELAIRLYGLPGFYTKGGEIRRRLPNERRTDEVRLANKGRTRRINRALCNQEDSSPLALDVHAVDENVRWRLYTRDAAQTKKVRSAERKAERDVRSRPGFIFEHVCYKGKVGVYMAIG